MKRRKRTALKLAITTTANILQQRGPGEKIGDKTNNTEAREIY
jgi:hypothetical protein